MGINSLQYNMEGINETEGTAKQEKLLRVLKIFVNSCNGNYHKYSSPFASNAVIDWFGRTIKGQSNIIKYYNNSSTTYEHELYNIETCDAIEERPTHISTKQIPSENICSELTDVPSNNYLLDKFALDSPRTPPRKAITVTCPPAPCRGRFMPEMCESDTQSSGSEDDSDDLSGIEALDDVDNLCGLKKTDQDSPKCKKMHMTKLTNNINCELSQYSDLKYLTAIGIVKVSRHSSSSHAVERSFNNMECKMGISYRIHNECPDKIQIALVIYQPNSMNLRSRRNLLNEFKNEQNEECIEKLTTITATATVTPHNGTIRQYENKCNSNEKSSEKRKLLKRSRDRKSVV